MYNDSEMLQFICQGTEMGLDSISAVLKQNDDPEMKRVLADQHGEYEKIHEEAKSILRRMGDAPESVGPIAKASSSLMTAAKTLLDNSPSKIAEMMIQGSTMGVTEGLKHLHGYQNGNGQIRELADKLLHTEQKNIEQMKSFL